MQLRRHLPALFSTALVPNTTGIIYYVSYTLNLDFSSLLEGYIIFKNRSKHNVRHLRIKYLTNAIIS